LSVIFQGLSVGNGEAVAPQPRKRIEANGKKSGPKGKEREAEGRKRKEKISFERTLLPLREKVAGGAGRMRGELEESKSGRPSKG
jgi:hypothetical protein